MSTETTTSAGLGMAVTQKTGGELAVSAAAAKAKALVEAQYVIAYNRPRNINSARLAILEACKRPGFAEGAIYRKPVGGGTVDGFSIRFAETAIQSMGNIAVDTQVIYEDDDKLTVHISVTDLEKNVPYGDDVTIRKTVERKKLQPGQVPISERVNSRGEKTFLVHATDEELLNKINAAKSKVIRNCGLRLIPQDILDEAWNQVLDTQEKGGKDPKAELKKLCDAFHTVGVPPGELERFLGHSLESVSPKELANLRGHFVAIRDQETSWSEIMDKAAPKRANVEVVDPKTVGESMKSAKPAIPPYEQIVELASKADVSLEQVLVVLKERHIAEARHEELPQLADAKLAKVVENWGTLLPDIKKVQM